MDVSTANARLAHATRNEISLIENTRQRRLLFRRLARDVGRRVDQGQALLSGDDRARRVFGVARGENRVKSHQRDALGQILTGEQPDRLRRPVVNVSSSFPKILQLERVCDYLSFGD